MPEVNTRHALTYAHQLTQDQGLRVRELKKAGRHIFGYMCCSVPLELFTALDIVPYRILGNMHEPITRADAHLENNMCSFVRSCFDLSLKGKYDFLDGLVGVHSCDSIQRVYDVWNYCHGYKYKYSHFIDMPHAVTLASKAFYTVQLDVFKHSLESYVGRTMSNADLRRAIDLHNENRRLLRQLYDLRKQDPPLILGSEVTKVLLAGMFLPIQEYSQLIHEVTAVVTSRRERPPKGGARIFLYGSMIDDTALIEMVEGAGANVVIDDCCTGTRTFWQNVEITPNPLDGLTVRYLDGIPCPRTFRDLTGSHEDDIENRFRYIGEFIHDFGVDAVILSIIRFCDVHELDAPDVRDYLRNRGLPVLHLTDAYDSGASGQLRTRVQAFLEMAGMKGGA
ncbi:MAG: 2-hydroxyacyl-CoA dehydratase family protein [Dehalococcoidia bacterium]|nr:2-hydroxyacyl-CoA dehydratase family protein [Dehalococcoidia bacterium]